MSEIKVIYYDINFPQGNAFKIKHIIEKVRETKPTMSILAFNRKKGYGEIIYFSSGPMILEKSELVAKIGRECDAGGINKEDFKIEIR